MLIGGATKQADRLLHMDKVYDAEITLGVTSATGDAEGPLTPQEHTVPSETDINSSLQRFTGEITQTPSMYSAIKVGGQAAYKRARNGENVVVPSRSVTIKRISLEQYSYPRVKFEAEVTSGTYIRSLAQDVGINLNTGAYLSNLRRLSIGEYSLNDAHALDDINSQNVEACLFVLRSVS